MRCLVPLLGAVLASCGNAPAAPPRHPAARPAATAVTLHSIGRFSAPVYLTSPPGDTSRIFVAQRGGSVVVLRDGKRAGTFLRVSTSTEGERGLLGMAFAPDYAQSGLIYVFYTAPSGEIRIDEFHADPNADHVDAGSQRTVLSVPHPESNHVGGQIAFGPDGLLYIGMGDGGQEGDPHRYGQNLGVLYGKLLRIDPRKSGSKPYAIPADNPFVHRKGARPQIYAYGLRNPWRFSFDAKGGITIGDVGQDRIEELDHEPKDGARGANFGWSAFEGRAHYNAGRAPGAVPPVIQHTHAAGWCSIVGGYELAGRYVYGDLCQPRLWWAKLRNHSAASDRPLNASVSQLVSFGQDGAGHLYALAINGPVYRVDPR